LEANNEISFKELFDLYKSKVFNTVISYLQNQEDAEEVTQDVFIEIYRSLSKFKGNSSLSTWIYRIAVNKSIDFLRKKKSKKSLGFFGKLFFDDIPSASKHELKNFDHPGALLEQKENSRLLFKLINDLKANQKTVIILFYIEELSQKQIAEIMGISTKAVELLVRRAKLKLKEKLEKLE
jgi:RNA polymerase sigma-70 factor (ECF subfamily)